MNKQMTVVYLAGALRGNVIKKFMNMRRAKRIAKELWLSQKIVYSPHLNSGWLDHPNTDLFILPANLEILRRCDMIMVMPGWENSSGTIAEIEFAMHNHIGVIYLDFKGRAINAVEGGIC